MNHVALIALLAVTLLLALFYWGRMRVRRKCNCDAAPEGEQEPSSLAQPRPEEPFLIKPYLQLGTSYGVASDAGGSLEIVWHSQDEEKTFWTVILRNQDDGLKNFNPEVARALLRTVDIASMGTIPAHSQHRALVSGRTDGAAFVYDVYRNGKPVFSATGKIPRLSEFEHRFIAVGDIANGRIGQAKIAFQMSRYQPDLVVVPGDVVYQRGLFSENLAKLFPIMNCDETAFDKGAPLMRSIPFVSIPGNHDYGRPDPSEIPNLDTHPGVLAWFYLWSQPLNGPAVGQCQTNVQTLNGSAERQQALWRAFAERYPRMANFSFDFAGVHWTFLDANPHMDWSCTELRDWLRNDLSSSRATWKFVVYHQPAFTSHARHRFEPRMRLVADIFQECGVDICFTGHAHWYERIYPIKFELRQQPDGRSISADGLVDGEYTLDTEYDGLVNTRPQGVINITTGGGGAKLQIEDLPKDGWAPFTHKLISHKHSFSVVDVSSSKVTLRQISEDGEELDRFVITK